MQTAITPLRGSLATQHPPNTSLFHAGFLPMWPLVPLGLEGLCVNLLVIQNLIWIATSLDSSSWQYSPRLIMTIETWLTAVQANALVGVLVLTFVPGHCPEAFDYKALLFHQHHLHFLEDFLRLSGFFSTCLGLFAPHLSQPGFALRSKTQPKRPSPP